MKGQLLVPQQPQWPVFLLFPIVSSKPRLLFTLCVAAT